MSARTVRRVTGPRLSPTRWKRNALFVFAFLMGAGMAMVVRGFVGSGIGLSRLNASERCAATPGCGQAIWRCVGPGAVLVFGATLARGKLSGQKLFGRNRGSTGGQINFRRRRSTTTMTRYHSTWDGPVQDSRMTKHDESDVPLTDVEAEDLLRMLERSDADVLVDGAVSDADARRAVTGLLRGHAELVPTSDEASTETLRVVVPRRMAVSLVLAGAAAGLVYAELVLP